MAAGPEQRRHQVGQRLAGARGGMDEQELLCCQAAGDLACHAVLALAVAVARAGSRFRGKEGWQVNRENILEDLPIFHGEWRVVFAAGRQGLAAQPVGAVLGHPRTKLRQQGVGGAGGLRQVQGANVRIQVAQGGV